MSDQGPFATGGVITRESIERWARAQYERGIYHKRDGFNAKKIESTEAIYPLPDGSIQINVNMTCDSDTFRRNLAGINAAVAAAVRKSKAYLAVIACPCGGPPNHVPNGIHCRKGTIG